MRRHGARYLFEIPVNSSPKCADCGATWPCSDLKAIAEKHGMVWRSDLITPDTVGWELTVSSFALVDRRIARREVVTGRPCGGARPVTHQLVAAPVSPTVEQRRPGGGPQHPARANPQQDGVE